MQSGAGFVFIAFLPGRRVFFGRCSLASVSEDELSDELSRMEDFVQ